DGPQAIVWTGTQMVVIQPGTSAAFDPATDSRTAVPALPVAIDWAEWTGSEVIAWVDSEAPAGVIRLSGYSWVPRSGAWTSLPGQPGDGWPFGTAASIGAAPLPRRCHALRCRLPGSELRRRRLARPLVRDVDLPAGEVFRGLRAGRVDRVGDGGVRHQGRGPPRPAGRPAAPPARTGRRSGRLRPRRRRLEPSGPLPRPCRAWPDPSPPG